MGAWPRACDYHVSYSILLCRADEFLGGTSRLLALPHGGKREYEDVGYSCETHPIPVTGEKDFLIKLVNPFCHCILYV